MPDEDPGQKLYHAGIDDADVKMHTQALTAILNTMQLYIPFNPMRTLCSVARLVAIVSKVTVNASPTLETARHNKVAVLNVLRRLVEIAEQHPWPGAPKEAFNVDTDENLGTADEGTGPGATLVLPPDGKVH